MNLLTPWPARWRRRAEKTLRRIHASDRAAATLALVAGAILPLAFAPYRYPWIGVLAPAVLFALWHTAGPRLAAWRGYLFGLGFFGGGVSWIYYSLHDFGRMPPLLAGAMVALFVGFLAGYPALLGWLQARVRGNGVRLLVFLPAAWVLLEWIRGWFLTGFPWLHLGYSQIDTALAGFAPYLGVYGVSWFVALCAGLLIFAAIGVRTVRARVLALLAIAVVFAGGAGLGRVGWTQPVGAPISAALVQANIDLSVKWRPSARERILQDYVTLTRAAMGEGGNPAAQLIVWPETAAPAYLDQLDKEYLPRLTTELAAHGAALVFGTIEREGNAAYNSVVSIDGERRGVYRKRHLVPFGEYLPLSTWLAWLLDYLHIPMSDFSEGRGATTPIFAAGQPIGVSICYEDAFGEEVIQTLPAATLLVNVSEDAWFGDSLAPHQHLQMARMRARETGRYLLRATNTGVSAIIAPDGRLLATAPQFATEVVRAAVQPLAGATPYVRVGNWPVVLWLSALVFAVALGSKRR